METDVNGRSSRHRPRPAYYEDSVSKSSVTSDLSVVSIDDQSMTDSLVEDQPVALMLAKASLLRARNDLKVRLKVINGALECIEEKLELL